MWKKTFKRLILLEYKSHIEFFGSNFIPHPACRRNNGRPIAGSMSMRDFHVEIGAFKEARRAEIARAQQMVAFQLACGIDLSEAQDNGPAVAAHYAAKVRRLLERERIRGVRRHWSYDLNRHIALKEVLDELLKSANPQTSARQSGHAMSLPVQPSK